MGLFKKTVNGSKPFVLYPFIFGGALALSRNWGKISRAKQLRKKFVANVKRIWKDSMFKGFILFVQYYQKYSAIITT